MRRRGDARFRRMIVLAVDTCLGACQAALWKDGRVLGAASEPMSRGHQERVAPLVRELMAGAGLPFSGLDRIGVTVGPGSFTGLRVGVAFAKGLGLALGKVCVGVGVLPALAASEAPQACAAVIDAGRGRFYLQPFEGGEALAGPDVLEIDEALARLVEIFPHGAFALVGPAASALAPAWLLARRVPLAAPDPAQVAALAALAPPVPARPLYLRPPDATPKAARRA